MIKLKNISFRYPGADRDILSDFSCEFRPGEITAVTGSNGCGKTTLMKLMTGVLKPDSGSIAVCRSYASEHDTGKAESDGGAACEYEDISELTLSQIGRIAGFVYQDPSHQLFCETVFEEIAYGLRNLKTLDETRINERVTGMIKYFRLDGKEEHYPGTMSQGEKQRVMLAAVMALDTGYVILDEPTSGLDMEGCRQLGKMLQAMSADGVGVIMVSHEREFIDEYANTELRLSAAGSASQQHADDNAKNTAGRSRAGLRTLLDLGRLDARARIFASMCFVMAAVFSEDPRRLICIFAVTALLPVIGGLGLKNTFYRARGMAGLAAGLFVLQCVFLRSGEPALSAGSYVLITWDGLNMAAVSALRLMILTFTALLMMTGDIRGCLAGFLQMHIPYEIVFMVMAALKFLPFLREQSTDVMNAARMRGAAFDSMSLPERLRLYLKLTVPITAGAIRRADRMNVAMAARGFRAYPGRTRFYTVSMHMRDWVFMAVSLISVLLICYLF